MRLIDADSFKRFLQALCKAGAPYYDVIQLLDKEPTAYDVEKVVAELEKELGNAQMEYTLGNYNLDNDIGNKIIENYRQDMNEGKCFALGGAIDIVRKGGVK